MKKILFGLLTLLFLACENQEGESYRENEFYYVKEFSYEDIPNETKLTGIPIKIEGAVYPRGIVITDYYLVVSEDTGDRLLHVIDKRNMEIKHSIGRMGRGPGEIGLSRHLLKGRGNEFWAYQIQDKKVDRFDAESDSATSLETIRFGSEMRLVVNFSFSSDSTYMTTLMDGNEKFVEFNAAGNMIGSYDTWGHMLEGEMPPSVISSIHQGKLKAGTNRKHYILPCIQLDRIEILDKAEGKVTSVRGPIHHMPTYEVDYSQGYPMAMMFRKTLRSVWVNIETGENKFYALFSGASSMEVNTGKRYCNDIFVFDYEGNVLERYVFDHSIHELAVDEVQRKFYGLSFEDPSSIVVFDF